MTRVSVLFFCAVLSLIALSGCVPGEDDHVDETRDPNYLRGRAKVNSQDFIGAIDEFEKALEVNPRSAAAHFEMAWLCEEKTKDYAEAIYHYEKHLKLRPNSEKAERARQQIEVCKRELAAAEYSPSGTQHELDRLNAENVLLRQNVETLRGQLVAATLAAQSHPAPLAQPPTNPAPPPNSVPLVKTSPVPLRTAAPQPGSANGNLPEAQPAAIATTNLTPQVPVAAARTHVVQSGETPSSIAKQFHVTLATFLQANPAIKDPKKLRVGQTVVLP